MKTFLVVLVLTAFSAEASRPRMQFARYRSWNSRMYPVWNDGDSRYRDCWRGGEVTFDVRNDAPTLTGAKATFSIDLRFPQNQTALPDGQVVWAQNCTINGTHYQQGEPVYPENNSTKEWIGVFPDGTPFTKVSDKKLHYIFVWKTWGHYWQVADGPSSSLTIGTDNIPLGSYSMELVIYHCRGKDKFIPLGYASTQFTITDQIPFSVSLTQINDVNQEDRSFIQNRAIAFSINLHDPSQYLKNSGITFNWDFGDNSGTLISQELSVTHTYVTTGTFRPQVVLQATIPDTSCATPANSPTAANPTPALVTSPPPAPPAEQETTADVQPVPEEPSTLNPIAPTQQASDISLEVPASMATAIGDVALDVPASVAVPAGDIALADAEAEREAAAAEDPAVTDAAVVDPGVADEATAAVEAPDVDAEDTATDEAAAVMPAQDAAAAEDAATDEAAAVAPAEDAAATEDTTTDEAAAVAPAEAAVAEVPQAETTDDLNPVIPDTTVLTAVMEAEEAEGEAAEAEEAVAVLTTGTVAAEGEETVLEMALETAMPAVQVPVVVAKRQAPAIPAESGCIIYRYGSFSTALDIVQGIESVEIVQVANVVTMTAVEQNAVDLTVTCQGSLPNEVCTVVSDADCATPVQTECNAVTPTPECQVILRQFFNDSGVFCINVSMTNDVSLAVTSARVSVTIGSGSTTGGTVAIVLGIMILASAIGAIALTYKRFKQYQPLREDPEGSSTGSLGRTSVPVLLWNLLSRQTAGESRPLLQGRVV
ncbi:premelanosome protein a [Megalops cyprinoides]|uniref:premelanosome protein a n=1 Tax=Megalops cyprinoides TaxID=118141 RepID=UPI001864896E|nr:premelanosome protein a [Megalops cyprinoides]